MAKRPHERNPSESNGRGKWQKTASGSVTKPNQLKVPPGAVVFRVLCHSSKFGSIIGKNGVIVTKIRQETGAKIRIEDTVQGCEDRVVVITGSEKEAEASKEPNKEDKKVISTGIDGDVDEENKPNTENDEKKVDSPALESTKSERPLSSAQKALLLVYGRLVEGETEDDNVDDDVRRSSPFSVRLLIFPSQVDSLNGKGGTMIKQMSSDSGAQIEVLPKDQLPLCASPIDEVVQISGGIDSVKKALHSVSQLLVDNPPHERDLASNPMGPPSHPFATFPRAEIHPPANFLPPARGPHFPSKPFDSGDNNSNFPPFQKFHEGSAPGSIQGSPQPITYRLMCSNDKVGNVIGKGGSIIKGIHHETGCDIKVLETVDPEDRVIVVSGAAFPGDRISPAQDALLRVQERIVMAGPDNKESTVSSRLLVSSNQTGCLLGRGGSIISEMRKLTGAQIRVLGRDQVPRSVADDDELVQVTGEWRTVQDALFQITTRLRHHLFRDKLKVSSMNQSAHPLDQMPPFGPYVGRRESSPPRMYSNLPPFPNDPIGRPHEERPFPHIPGAPLFERMPPAPWAPQGMREGGGPMPMPDFGGATSQRRTGGFPSGNQPTVTVDVVVPRALVPSIYGEDGFCLRRIREISEAKITITEPRPEATETVIIISGIPEQTHAAQSLLQAFVLSETAPP